MSAAAPLAIVAGAAIAMALLVITGWEHALRRLEPFGERYRLRLERAQLRLTSEELVVATTAAAALLWSAYAALARPTPLLAVLAAPIALALTFGLTGAWIDLRVRRRLAAFNDQLELVLRLLSSGMRAGLSMRQAFVLVAEEATEPTRTEFGRVLAQTNVGVPINDALDALAVRMPSSELQMLVRTVRIHAQTGGNLARILDHLATTIKERRRIHRKIRALTAEGSASAWVIGVLPIGVGLFVVATQPHMRAATLTTAVGHLCLVIFAVLETLGIVVLSKVIRIDI